MGSFIACHIPDRWSRVQIGFDQISPSRIDNDKLYRATFRSPGDDEGCWDIISGRKNVLRKLLRISYRRLKAGFFVCWRCWPCSTVFVCWLRLNEMHKVWTFASRKAFLLLCVVFVLRHLKIPLDSEQPMLKQKRIIPSVWGGIKSFEHFQRGEYFSDCALDFIFVSWFRPLSPGWIKNRLYSVYLVNTFSHAQIYSLCRTSFTLLFSQVKEPFVRRKTFSEIERQL